jgi:hypothetical protein
LSLTVKFDDISKYGAVSLAFSVWLMMQLCVLQSLITCC